MDLEEEPKLDGTNSSWDAWQAWARRQIQLLASDVEACREGNDRLYAANGSLRIDNDRLKAKVTDLEETVRAHEKLAKARQHTDLLRPGSKVFVGPEGYPGLVVAAIVRAGGVYYEAGWWVAGLWHRRELPASEVRDELPLPHPSDATVRRGDS